MVVIGGLIVKKGSGKGLGTRKGFRTGIELRINWEEESDYGGWGARRGTVLPLSRGIMLGQCLVAIRGKGGEWCTCSKWWCLVPG